MENENDVEVNVVGLTSLRDGALVEMFDREMQVVAKNIGDPNTSPKRKRSIKIQIDFGPNEEGTSAVVGISCSSTLAPIKPAATTIYLRELADGRMDVTEYNPKQPKLTFG